MKQFSFHPISWAIYLPIFIHPHTPTTLHTITVLPSPFFLILILSLIWNDLIPLASCMLWKEVAWCVIISVGLLLCAVRHRIWDSKARNILCLSIKCSDELQCSRLQTKVKIAAVKLWWLPARTSYAFSRLRRGHERIRQNWSPVSSASRSITKW